MEPSPGISSTSSPRPSSPCPTGWRGAEAAGSAGAGAEDSEAEAGASEVEAAEEDSETEAEGEVSEVVGEEDTEEKLTFSYYSTCLSYFYQSILFCSIMYCVSLKYKILRDSFTTFNFYF